MEILTRWQDPTIDDLIKENLELKRKLGETDDAVEYWQIECDKRGKVLDKIKEKTTQYKKDLKEYEEKNKHTNNSISIQLVGIKINAILELLEEIK